MRTGRLEGLDAWRAVLMLGGLLLHGSVWQEDRPLFEGIALISHSFRMGSFFAISGYLCAAAMLKRPPRQWLTRRVAQIGLPTLFGLLVICPLISATIALRPAQAHGTGPLPFDWYHLWFLVALLIYAPFTVLAHEVEQRRRGAKGSVPSVDSGPRTLLPLMLAVSGMSFVLMVAASLLVGALAPTAYYPMLSECRMIAGYLPLYLFGFAVMRLPRLQEAASASPRAPIAVVMVVATLYVGWYALVAPGIATHQRVWADEAVQLIGAALCPPAVFLLIVRSALRIRRTPAFLHRLCEASLTIYLVHMPLLVAINLAFATVDWNPYLEFSIAVSAAGLLAYGIHMFVVRPVPLLMLLVNGQIDRLARREPVASVDEPRHHLAIGAADLHLRA